MLSIDDPQTYVNCANISRNEPVTSLVWPRTGKVRVVDADALLGPVRVLSLRLQVLGKPGSGFLPSILGSLGMIRSALVTEKTMVGIGVNLHFKRFAQRAQAIIDFFHLGQGNIWVLLAEK